MIVWTRSLSVGVSLFAAAAAAGATEPPLETCSGPLVREVGDAYYRLRCEGNLELSSGSVSVREIRLEATGTLTLTQVTLTAAVISWDPPLITADGNSSIHILGEFYDAPGGAGPNPSSGSAASGTLLVGGQEIPRPPLSGVVSGVSGPSLAASQPLLQVQPGTVEPQNAEVQSNGDEAESHGAGSTSGWSTLGLLILSALLRVVGKSRR